MTTSPPTKATLVPVGTHGVDDRVNVFVHGYRAMASSAEIDATIRRVRDAGVVGESHLLNWMAGRWAESAAVAGLRTAYRVTRATRLFSPWALAADAGLMGLHEAAQFKRMEWRAERVGAELPERLATIAEGRPVNLIGHSLGARVVHACLRSAPGAEVTINDVVLLAGAADLDAKDWPDCVATISGRVYNAHSRRDRVLWMTPDLRRRVGSRPMRQIVVNGEPKVVNHYAESVGHVQHWTRLAEHLPRVWPGYRA